MATFNSLTQPGTHSVTPICAMLWSNDVQPCSRKRSPFVCCSNSVSSFLHRRPLYADCPTYFRFTICNRG
jgi:hypothetical protein